MALQFITGLGIDQHTAAANQWRQLTKAGSLHIIERIERNRAVAQLVARLVRDQEVGGSNPPCPTNYSICGIFLTIFCQVVQIGF